MKLKNLSLALKTSLYILFFGTFFLGSCRNKKDFTKRPHSFRMFCRETREGDVGTSWRDRGYTTSTHDNHITLLQFKTNKIDDRIQMELNPLNSRGDIIVDGIIKLSRTDDCYGDLDLATQYVDNYIPFSELRLVSNPETGELVNFSYIRIKPVQDHRPYVNFQVDVVLDNGSADGQVLTSARTNPCPPPQYCPSDFYKMQEQADTSKGEKKDTARTK